MMAASPSWLRRLVPTREHLERNRPVGPFAGRVLRSDLWRFNRRSRLARARLAEPAG